MDFLHAILIWSLLHFGTTYGKKILKDRVSTLERNVEELESEKIGRNELIRLLTLNVTKLNNEVSTLERKVEELESEKIGRNELIKLLTLNVTKLNKEDSGSDGNASGEESTGDEITPLVVPPVTVLEVRRESLESEEKFTVRYRPDDDDFTIHWYDRRIHESIADYTDQSLSDGTRETSVVVSSVPHMDKRGLTDKIDFNSTYFSTPDFNSNNFSTNDVNIKYLNTTEYVVIKAQEISVHFLSHEGGGMAIVLRKGDGDAVETDISVPVFKVEPTGDLVYEDGKDILVKLTTPPVTDDYNSWSARRILAVQSILIDPESGELVQRFVDHEHYLERLDNKSFPDHHEWNVKLKTSEYKTSGLLTFATSFGSDTESSLIGVLWLGKLVILRPSTQDGPFPAGYLGFVREVRSPYTTQQDGAIVCRAESVVCRFDCAAAGDRITDLEVHKVKDDGTREPVENIPGLHKTDFVTEYLRRAETMLPLNPTTRDSERFECVATNARGKNVTKEVVVSYL